MRKKEYENWKGIRILEAEKIEESLRLKLGRNPKKRDFIEAGKYSVWMALYRHQRKTHQVKREKFYFNDLEYDYIHTIRDMINNVDNIKLISQLFEDFARKLGPVKTGQILTQIEERELETLSKKLYSNKKQDDLKSILYYLIREMGVTRIRDTLNNL